MELPLSLFDGQPFSSPIRQLQKEWQQLLSQPTKDQLNQGVRLTDLVRIGIVNCDKQIAFLESTIVKLELHSSQLRYYFSNNAYREVILGHYTSLIKYYRQCLTSAHSQKEKHVRRMEALSN